MELLLGSLGFWFESVLLLSWTIVGWRENDPMSQRNPLRTPLRRSTLMSKEEALVTGRILLLQL